MLECILNKSLSARMQNAKNEEEQPSSPAGKVSMLESSPNKSPSARLQSALYRGNPAVNLKAKIQRLPAHKLTADFLRAILQMIT